MHVPAVVCLSVGWSFCVDTDAVHSEVKSFCRSRIGMSTLLSAQNPMEPLLTNLAY